jgi:hypothetical protein
MRKLVLVLFLLVSLVIPLHAQDATEDATPEAGAEGASSIVVTDQVSLDGTVVVQSVTSEGAGWLAIHVDMNGQPGPTVGIAPVVAGANENLVIPIDTLGATPALLAVLHVDDGTQGAYEFEMRQMADPMVTSADGLPVMAPFRIAAVRAFDHQLVENNAIIGSVISDVGGWLVIHADNGGQPGPVLGQTLLVPGTNPAVIVPLSAEGVTPVLYPMLHVDDNEVGVYEFGTVEGADNPVVINEVVAVTSFNVTEAPTVLNALGVPLEVGADVAPVLAASSQELPVGTTPDEGEVPTFIVDSVTFGAPGWIDVHADAGGHPGASLGVAPVTEGENTQLPVELNQMMTAIPVPLPPLVWPMLHVDDNEPGVYEWLVIPGADAPVVYNGTVVTVPVMVGMMPEGNATDEAGMMATDEAGMVVTEEMGDMVVTEEAGATAEATPAG